MDVKKDKRFNPYCKNSLFSLISEALAKEFLMD